MKTKRLLVFLVVLLPFALFAQQADSVPAERVWSLKQCVDYALANNLTVKRGELAVQSSSIDVTSARWGRYPTINGSASYGYSWGRGLDPVSNDFVAQEIKSSNLGANGSLPLINGLNNYNTVKQSTKAYAASEYELAKSKNDVILTVASIFINVVFNKELVENARYQLESTRQQLDRTRKQVEAGALAKSEQLNLEAQLAGNELTLVQQENALALSLLQLKQALQIPASEPLDVEIPVLEAEDMILENTRDEIFEQAKSTLPQIKGADLRIQSSMYSLKAARGNYYPRLNLVANLNTNYSSRAESVFVPDPNNGFAWSPRPIGFVGQDESSPVYVKQPTGTFTDAYGIRDQFQDNIYRTLSLQLLVPIFNGYQARGSVQRARIQYERARIDATEISNTLRQDVENAYNDALAASKTYGSATRQVAAREEAFRMMTQRYNAGSANSFEYQVSQNDLYRAQTDLTRAKYDFIFRKKVLDFYQGKSLAY